MLAILNVSDLKDTKDLKNVLDQGIDFEDMKAENHG